MFDSSFVAIAERRGCLTNGSVQLSSPRILPTLYRSLTEYRDPVFHGLYCVTFTKQSFLVDFRDLLNNNSNIDRWEGYFFKGLITYFSLKVLMILDLRILRSDAPHNPLFPVVWQSRNSNSHARWNVLGCINLTSLPFKFLLPRLLSDWKVKHGQSECKLFYNSKLRKKILESASLSLSFDRSARLTEVTSYANFALLLRDKI